MHALKLRDSQELLTCCIIRLKNISQEKMMWRFLGRLLDRIFVIVGALLFMQFPLFMQNYVQQIVGRVEELKLQIEALRHIASLSQKTLEQYIQKFVENSDADFMRQGEFMQSLVERWETLSQALFSLQQAAPIQKPFLFLSSYNHEIAASTFHHFEFGLLLTLEGAVYSLIGMLIGLATFNLCRSAYFLIASRTQRKIT